MDRGSSSGVEEPRHERFLSATLVVITGLLLLSLFDFYDLPHNDWAIFSQAAGSFAGLQLPEELKAAPVYPALIALAAGMDPSEEVLLRAAQWISLLAGLSLLLVLRALGRCYLPTLSPLLLLLVAFSPCFLELALQPLLEALLVLLVALTFLGVARKRSSASCFAASAATLTRLDAGPLIPLAIGVRLLKGNGWARRLLPCLLAGLGPAAWLLLGLMRHRYGSPYFETMLAGSNLHGYELLPRSLARMLFFLPPTSGPLSVWMRLAALSLLAPVLIGAWKLWRQDRCAAWVWFGFLGGYAVIHAAYRGSNYRYNWPLQVFLVFLVLKALEPETGSGPDRKPALAGLLQKLRPWHPWARPTWVLAALLVFAAAALLGGIRFYQTLHVRWAWAFAVLFSAVFFGARTAGLRKGLGPAVGLGLVLLAVFSSLRTWESAYLEQKTRFSEHLAAARWIEKHAAPGERALMAEPWIIEPRMPGVAQARFVSAGAFQAEDPIAYLGEVWAAGVDYVIWLSYYADMEENQDWLRRSGAHMHAKLDLGRPVKKPALEFLATLDPAPGHRANIYRIRPGLSGDRGAGMDPRYEESARKLLGKGWRDFFEGPPGERFLWSVDLRSTLVLHCRRPSVRARIVFAASPRSGPHAGLQSVQVFIEDLLLGEVVLAPGRNTYALEIPMGRLQDGPNRLEFRFAHLGRSEGEPASQDEKGLTAQFFRIGLVTE